MNSNFYSLKTILTLILILAALHACQSLTERSAIEENSSQPQKEHTK